MFKTRERIEKLEKNVAYVKSQLNASISEQEELTKRFDEFVANLKQICNE